MTQIYGLVRKANREASWIAQAALAGMPCHTCGRGVKPLHEAQTDDEGNVTWHPDRDGLPGYWRAAPGMPYPTPEVFFCCAWCSFLDYEKRKIPPLPEPASLG